MVSCSRLSFLPVYFWVHVNVIDHFVPYLSGWKGLLEVMSFEMSADSVREVAIVLSWKQRIPNFGDETENHVGLYPPKHKCFCSRGIK